VQSSEIQAFMLHQYAYGDSSRIIELFSAERGRTAVIAKGIRQSKRGNLVPFQHYRVQVGGRGELPILQQAEPLSRATWLSGEASMAGLYLNELFLHLLPRDDPHPELFQAYLQSLPELATSTASTLRHLEWRLLVAMGYAPDLARDAHGLSIEPDRRYLLEPHQGFVQSAEGAWSGAGLIALRAGSESAAGEQRRLLRHLLGLHLEGKQLKSWGMLHALRELTRGA